MLRLLTVLLALEALAAAQTYGGLIGVEIDSGHEASPSRMFVDLGKVFRPCSVRGGSSLAPVDANGWPTTDADCVIFDARPVAAWANPPSIDDPARFQVEMGGTYQIAFTGQARLSVSDPGKIVISNKTWNAKTNTTTAVVEIAPGAGLVVLTFTGSRRTPESAENTGFTNLKFLRPGYALDTTQVFTPEFLRALHPFNPIRFMDFTETNNSNPAYTDSDNKTHWSDRHLPSDATQQSYSRKRGVAWEYAVLLANLTEKDMWINIPVSADDDYVLQLARLLKSTLKPGLKIYIEHSNEVWNPGFTQCTYNTAAANAEVSAGNSPLASSYPAEWPRRRHAKRLIEIGNIFKSVYGPDALNNSIRLIYAWWTIYPYQYQDVLNWVKATYGPPDQFFYALAQTHYFNDQRASQTADAAGVLAAMRLSSDNGNQATASLRAVAQSFGLRHAIYEGGPDNGGGSTTNVANRILANREPAMKDLLTHDIRDNWFAGGGDLYMYFALCSAYSRYGSWGASEDITDTNTPKFQALHELLGMTAAPAIAANGIADAASYRPTVSPGAFMVVYGSNFAGANHTWDAVVADGVTLPTSLGGVTVRIGGKYGAIYFASPGQINVVVPPDLEPGDVPVEITTTRGTSRSTVTAARYAPAFFSHTVGGKLMPVAQLANTAVLVAPEASVPGATSRPAAAGDYLQFYASGLGPTEDPVPSGRVLARPYAVADLSRVRVTIGGIDAPVLYAGMTYPGVFQVNIRVPNGIPAGEQPVILHIGGQSTQPEAVLPFK